MRIFLHWPQLQNVYGVYVMSEYTSHSCAYSFCEETWKTYDDERSGWPRDALNDKTRPIMFAILECDQKFTICEIWDLLVDERWIEVSHMVIQHVLATEDYTKVSRDGYTNNWLMKINECKSTQNGNFWHSTQVIWQWFHISSRVMNCGFSTLPWHRKNAPSLAQKRRASTEKILSRPFVGIKKDEPALKKFRLNHSMKKNSLHSVLGLSRCTAQQFPRRWE